MPNVQMPNGDIVGFPDDMPSDQIKGMIATKFPDFAKDNSYKASDPIRSGYQATMNTVAKPINNAVNSVVAPVMGKVAQAEAPAAQGVANALDTTASGQWVGNKLMDAKNELADLASYNPDLAKDTAAFGQNAQLLGNLTAAKGASGAVGDLVNQAESASTKLPGILGDTSGAPAAPSVPKIRNYDQIKTANNALADNTRAHYQNVEDLGASLTPEASQLAKDTLQQEVGDDLDQGLHPQTIGALNLFNRKAAQGLDWQSIDNTRKKLGMIAYDSNANANDIGAAKQAIRSINGIEDNILQDPDMLSNGTPDAMAALKAARAQSSLEQQHATIGQILRKANNNPNEIQSGFKSLYDDEGAFNRFTPENQQLIKNIAHPQKLVDNLQTIGKMGPGSNGSINLVQAGGLLSGNPVAMGIAGTTSIVGAGANMIRSSLVRGSAEQVLKNLEGKSIPVSAVGTPFNDAEYEAALDRMNQPAPPPAKPLALPPAERPMVGGRNQQLRPATDEEWQAMIDKGREARGTGLTPDVQKAQQTAKVSQYERDNPANTLFNKIGDKPMRPNQTALHEPTLGISKDEAFPEEGYKRGGEVNTNPSEAQIKAGNYKKEHIKLHGMDIAIENPKDSIRRGVDKGGKKWQVKMPASYGYIKKSVSNDGEHVDCFIGPNTDSKRIWVIDQKDADSGKFDEHKVMIGFKNRGQALAIYRKAFSDGKADKRIHAISEVSIDDFKKWLEQTRKDAA